MALTRNIIKSIDSTKNLNFEISKDFDGLEQLDTDLYARVTDTSITVVSSEPVKLGDEGDCSHLFEYTRFISIDLKNTDTSEVTNMSDMFYGCEAESLNLRNLETSNVTDMSYMFYTCEAKSLNLSNFDTSRVTDMSGMFRGCWAKSLDLGNLNTANVTDMRYMFCGCKTELLKLSSFDTSKVINMSSMFCGCESYVIDLSSFNTAKVANMAGMFLSSKASIVDLSNFVIQEDTYTNGMFTNSTSFFIRKQVTLTRELVENLDTFKKLEFKVHSEIEKAGDYKELAYNLYIKETASTITIASSRPIKLESKPDVLFDDTNFISIDLTNTNI